MTLWNIIRDWFVQNIWGGYDSNLNSFSSFIGYDLYEPTEFYNDDSLVKTGLINSNGDTISISLGDWLSTTSTIIVLVILCIIFGLMVRWLFRLTSGLLQGR